MCGGGVWGWCVCGVSVCACVLCVVCEACVCGVGAACVCGVGACVCVCVCVWYVVCRRGHPRSPNLKQTRMDQEGGQDTRRDTKSSRGVVATVTSIFGPVVANTHLYKITSQQFH